MGAMVSAMAITPVEEESEENALLFVGDSFGFVFIFDIQGYCLHGEEDEPPECKSNQYNIYTEQLFICDKAL